MKIIHVIENLDNSYGGPAKSVPLLVKYLNLLGLDNEIFTLKVHNQEENNIIKDNQIKIYKFSILGPKKIKYSKALEQAIISHLSSDTVLHLHSLWNYPAYVTYKIAKKYNIPLVVSIRGTMYKWALNQRKTVKKIAMFLFQKRMLQSASAIHVTEEGEVMALHNLGLYNKCILVPNGVEMIQNYKSIDKDLLDRIKYNKSRRYILFLGRIVHNKGIHYLLNSYKNLKILFSDIEVLVVGGIEEQNYYDGLEKLEGVHFLGQLDGFQKHTVFEIASLFVLPSQGENFSMAIAEAMSYKIPIVTTTGTPWKILVEKDAGWYVNLTQKNIDNAIKEALYLPRKVLKEMGSNAYNIIQNFTWDIQAKKMKDFYEEILKEHDV